MHCFCQAIPWGTSHVFSLVLLLFKVKICRLSMMPLLDKNCNNSFILLRRLLAFLLANASTGYGTTSSMNGITNLVLQMTHMNSTWSMTYLLQHCVLILMYFSFSVFLTVAIMLKKQHSCTIICLNKISVDSTRRRGIKSSCDKEI